MYAEGDLAQTSSGEALEAAASLFSNDEAVAHPFLDNKKISKMNVKTNKWNSGTKQTQAGLPIILHTPRGLHR